MSMSSGSYDYGRFDELAEEFAERYRRGERPSLQDYVDRLPEMAEEIREMFPALVEVERAEEDARDGPPATAPAATPRLREIADYRIVREIGRGGMGVVYEAEQVSLGRRVALKVLPGHAMGDRRSLERFRREAKAAARLHHTNIVPVYEVGQEADLSFYAMQLIQGQGLEQVIDELARLRKPDGKSDGHGPAAPEGTEPPAAVTQVDAATRRRQRELAWVAQSLLSGRLLAEGLESPANVASSAVGLDATEPANPEATWARNPTVAVRARAPAVPASVGSGSAVLPGGTAVSSVESSGRRLPFFRSVAQIGRQSAQGLAYAHARGVIHRDIKPSNLLLDTAGVVWITDFGLAKADDDGLTQTGDILGTLRYMAPERFRGEGDARADIYALGLTLYELLTLRPAYDGTDHLKLIEQVKLHDPARPRSLDRRIPRDLETIVLKAIDKDPARRYATAEAMSEDLRRFLADEPIQARRVSTAERYWRWARHNPLVATMGAMLTAVLVLATVTSIISERQTAALAENYKNAASAERSARQEANRQAKAESLARTEAEAARAAALGETYRATLSEARALRAARQPGWRDEALADLARLAASPSTRRDLVELRTEAVAALGTPDVRLIARIEPTGGFRSFAFSPDGRTLVTADHQKGLDLWDVQKLQHTGEIDGLAVIDPAAPGMRNRILFLPRGQGLAVATRDRGVVFLDPSGKPTSRPPITRGTHPPAQLSVDSEGRRIAVTWADGAGVTVHDLARGAISGEFPNSACALSPDGEWLARVSPQFEVLLHRIGSKEPEKTLGRHDGGIITLAFSADGTKVGSASMDRTAVLWDVAGQRQPVVLRGHRESINDVAFSPDGGWVVTASTDHTSRIWDVLTGQSLATLPGPWFIWSAGWSPDGAFLAAGVDNRWILLHRVTGRDVYQRLTDHRNGTQCVAAHPRLDRFATGADDHLVIDWDLATARPTRRWSIAHSRYVTSVAYSPDGSLLAAGAGDGELVVRDAETGDIRARLTGHQADIPAASVVGIPGLAFDPSGRRLASGDMIGRVIVWDLATGQPLRQLRVGASWVWSIAFLDGGRKLVSEVSNGRVALFDLQSGKTEAQITLPGGIRRFVADPARKRLVAALNNGDLCDLSLPDLTPGRRLVHAHPGAVESLVLSPDGRFLATGGADRRVVLRDPVTFEPLMALPEWTGLVKDLAFSPSGRWLAYVGADSDIALWDLAALRRGLQAAGLAWDQPATTTVPTDVRAKDYASPPAEVAIVRAENIDPAEFDRARGLVNSGVAAFQEGRFAAAVADLQQASERLQALRRSRPGDAIPARLHGISLGFLAGSLRDLKRPGEALARVRESLAAYESLNNPNPGDLYNMACGCALVSALDDRGSTDDRERAAGRALGYLRSAIEIDRDRILPLARDDRDFDPLRGRADFRDLMADASFPRDPFGPPSPLSRPAPGTPGAVDANTLLARKNEGHALLAAGLTRDGLSLLASASANDPHNAHFMLDVAALQAWFGKNAELAVTCRRALDSARDTVDPNAAERTAKACCLRLLGDKTRLDATLILARRAVRLGKGHRDLPYFQMALGMAEYRSGHYPAADEALLAAANTGEANPLISGTSAFYRAMSLFRQGKDAEARRVAVEAASRMKPLPADENNPLAGGSSHDDLILWMAYKEAKALLHLDAAPASPAKPDGH